MSFLLSVVVVVVPGGIPSSHAALLTNFPIADTYFEAYGNENKNFGVAPILRIDQWRGRQTLLRFAIDPGGARRVLRASLRLYITEVGFNEAGEFPELKTCVGLFDVVTPWTETGATFRTFDGARSWNQGAGIGGGSYTDVRPLPPPDIAVHLDQSAIALAPQSARKNSWLELDLTEHLRQRVRAGDRELSLLLRASTLGRNYTFHSRESTNAALRPHLRIDLDATQGDFRLSEPFIIDWKPGSPVKVNSRPATPRADQWKLIGKPAGSGVTESALLHGQITGEADGRVSFTPDRPGRYRFRVELSSPGDQQTVESADAFVLSVPPHPRLYVTAETLPKLRAQMRREARLFVAWRNWVEGGRARATEGRFHDLGPHEGCENTALAWLLTGHRGYLSNSIAYAQRILARRMAEHFHDVHEATFTGAAWVHAMACHYDWCYDELPDNHRQAVAVWLKEAAAWAWRRSGAPIAHNDGGARQCLLASAALALLGDDAEAPQFFRRSYQNFAENLLPWLNDGGRGGRSGDGGEYEGLHGFYLVRFAWMSHTATGEDLFLQSPFFFNRLKHLLFGWYPRRLVEPGGAYSMRQYYSPSGDHIRLGYVGDTQPYQSAAALCARFRDTPEAQGVRWLAGEWPTSWMQYTLKWAVLGDFENGPARPPTALAFLDAGCNTLFMRSDWSDDATWILFENSPLVSAHGSLDAGTFEIFKGDLLAARTGNLDHANVGAKHTMNYLHRTIAANALLVHDPAEKWKGFLGGAEGIDDGGGQRTNWPLTTSPDADTYLTYRDIFQRGHIQRFKDDQQVTYALADLTAAYNHPRWHGGKLNQPKVSQVTRQLLYLRDLDTLLVFDRVTSTKPEFKKTWLLHSLGDLDLLDGLETKVDEGEFHYTAATRAVIRHGWPKPVSSSGRCLSVTLLPERARLVKIGGRIDLPASETASWPGDRWHGQHRHRHLKDFWVNGTNYPPGNPPETRWFGEPTSTSYVPGTPDESGGRGKWRIEVSPEGPATNDLFFHVLCPRLGRVGSFPEVQRAAGMAEFAGAIISEAGRNAAVFFARTEPAQGAIRVTLPRDKTYRLVVADVIPGTYRVSINDRVAETVRVADDRLLVLAAASGRVAAQR